jgi:hypothetical protein
MRRPYYKKVDRSMMDWGLTIPQDYVKDFESRSKLRPGSRRDIEIIWDNKIYPAKLCHVKRTKYEPVYQIRWDNNKSLLKKLRKTYIQSYVILKSQKELFDIEKEKGEHFRTQLSGGQQEVLILQPLGSKKIKFEVFIRIENGWNALFERLAEENVFGWLFDKKRKYLISRSTQWINVKDFQKHTNAVNVIYYLANTKKKLLYIGKAEILGNRVTPGRDHQNMSGDWDKFRYDIVKLEYANILDKIEDHTIRSFASVLKNKKNYPSLEIGTYTIVNSNWKKL